MRRLLEVTLAAALFAGGTLVGTPRLMAMPQGTSAAATMDLAALLTSRKLEVVNREAKAVPDTPGAVQLSASPGAGLAWIPGSEFATGTIEVDVRGRDLFQQSFVGIAFHGQDDKTYEVVYLRPFNFRAEDPVRRQHAVQYAAVPDYDWPRLRKEFPEEFENPVGTSVEPTAWVPLKLVVTAKTIQIYVGPVKSPTLEVRKLGAHDNGLIGLWTGNNSDGAFANLRITRAKS
jgi:hypothetical protein